jgi:hypothetical protein
MFKIISLALLLLCITYVLGCCRGEVRCNTGCCPRDFTVCCSDGYHCCRRGWICDADDCIKGSSSEFLDELAMTDMRESAAPIQFGEGIVPS